MFGSLSKAGELDKFIPKSKEDFLEFAALLAQRGTAYSVILYPQKKQNNLHTAVQPSLHRVC